MRIEKRKRDEAERIRREEEERLMREMQEEEARKEAERLHQVGEQALTLIAINIMIHRSEFLANQFQTCQPPLSSIEQSTHLSYF